MWGNALLILNLSVDILNGVGGFDLNGEGLAKTFNLEDNEKKMLLKVLTEQYSVADERFYRKTSKLLSLVGFLKNTHRIKTIF